MAKQAEKSPHKVRPVRFGARRLMKAFGFDAHPEGAERELPTSSYVRLPRSAQIVKEREPALRKLRPMIDWCRAQALSLGLAWTVLTLGVGEYEALPPEEVYRKTTSAKRFPEHYTRDARGMPVLLKALLFWIRRITGLAYSVTNSVLTMGGLDGCIRSVLFLTDPGDIIVWFEPSWPNSKVFAESQGRHLLTLKLSPKDGWRIPARDEIVRRVMGQLKDWSHDRKKLIAMGIDPEGKTPDEILDLLVSRVRLFWCEKPGNPTGAGWQDEVEMRSFAEAARHFLAVGVVDEEYNFLYADGHPRTILSLGLEGIVVLSAWSKVLCLTSLRLGWMKTADPVLSELFRAMANLYLSAPNFMAIQESIGGIMMDFSWKGAIAYLLGLVREINQQRKWAAEAMVGAIGQYVQGDGAFYDVWVIPELRKGGALQALLFALTKAAQAIREGRSPEAAVMVEAIPLLGFYHFKDGPEGYRISLRLPEKRELQMALRYLRQQVDAYIAEGQPYIGTPADVTERFMRGEAIEPREWPVAKAA